MSALGNRTFGRGLALVLALPLLALAAAPARAQDPASACAGLASDSRFSGSAEMRLALAILAPAKRLPAFCEVKGTASPTPSSLPFQVSGRR